MTCTKPFLGPSQLSLGKATWVEVITMEEQLRGLLGDMRTSGPDSTLASASTMIQPSPSLTFCSGLCSGSHFVTHVLTTLPFP